MKQELSLDDLGRGIPVDVGATLQDPLQDRVRYVPFLTLQCQLDVGVIDGVPFKDGALVSRPARALVRTLAGKVSTRTEVSARKFSDAVHLLATSAGKVVRPDSGQPRPEHELFVGIGLNDEAIPLPQVLAGKRPCEPACLREDETIVQLQVVHYAVPDHGRHIK